MKIRISSTYIEDLLLQDTFLNEITASQSIIPRKLTGQRKHKTLSRSLLKGSSQSSHGTKSLDSGVWTVLII